VSYKIRNTIVLGVVFFVITAAGFVYWKFIQPGQLNKAQKEIKRIEQALQALPSTIEEVKTLTAQYYDTKRKFDSRSKEIPGSDITSQSYAYMSRGIDLAGSIKFNMRFKGATTLPDYGFNAYELYDGEAQFESLYRFVYYLENGRRLYKIRSLTLEQKEEVDNETKETRKWVAFLMELHAFFTPVAELATSLAAKAQPIPAAPFNPFDPLILQALAAEAPSGMVTADQVDVKAIIPGKAFVLFDGEVKVLQLGDRVWRGYVSKINPEQGLVEFILDEGGIVRKVEKYIQFGDKKKK
jgi:hypothetical protein